MVRALCLAVAMATAPPAAEDLAPIDDGGRKIVGVVTFDGSSTYGAPLSLELSAALRRRGHWARGGRSLNQVKSDLGCHNYEVACMSKAAELFGSNYVLFGTLRAEGSVHQLEMFLLDAEAGKVQSHVSAAIPEYDLSDGSIETKADLLLGQLWPEPGTRPAEFVPPPKPPPRRADAGPVPKWGYQKGYVDPWKWTGVGMGIGMTTFGIIMTSVAAGRLRQPGGPLERELFATAEASLNDGNPENDIDPAAGGDLCRQAFTAPADQPERVTNASVAQVCQNIDAWKTANWVGLGTTLIGAVSLGVFVPLLFYNGPNSKAARARVKASRRGLTLRF